MKRSFPAFLFYILVFFIAGLNANALNLLPEKNISGFGASIDKGFSISSRYTSKYIAPSFSGAVNQKNGIFLRSDSKVRISGMGGGVFEASLLNKSFALFLGGGCAITLNNFFIGAYGLALSTSHIYEDFAECPGDRVRLNFNHGGLWLGWEYKVKPFLGFGLSAKIGAGTVSYNNIDKTYFTRLDYTKNDVLVIIPQFETNIRLFPAIKLNIGIGYRALAGLDPDVYNTTDFFSPVLSITVLFGSFFESSDVPDVDE
jgi:hypothetical protein